jgi:hypothetical protein
MKVYIVMVNDCIDKVPDAYEVAYHYMYKKKVGEELNKEYRPYKYYHMESKEIEY